MTGRGVLSEPIRGLVLSAVVRAVRFRRWCRTPRAAAVAPFALLVALPLVMLVLNRVWLFPRPDTVDPWMYIGFFLHPKHHLTYFPDAYHGSRLPILLPGIAIYQALPAVGATIVLHLAQYYAAVFGLYFTVKRLVGHRAALLAAVLLGTNGMFLSAMSQGHPDGFGLPYFLLTALALTNACLSEKWRRWSLLAGVGAALFFFTNLAYGIHGLFFPWYLYAFGGHDRRKALVRGGYALAGFLLATLLMCGANELLCGRFWFFLSSLKVTPRLLANSWDCTGGRYSWVMHAGWLVTPLLVLGCGLVLWRRGRLHGEGVSPAAVPLVVGLAGVVGLLGVLEAGRIVHFLQFSFYCNILLAPTFLLAGVLLAKWVTELSLAEYRAAMVVAAGVGVLAALGGTAGGLTPVALVAAPLAFGLVAIACLTDPARIVRYPAAWVVGLLGVGNLLIGAGYDRFVTANPLERAHVAAELQVGRWIDPMPGVGQQFPRPTRIQVMRATAEALELVVGHDTRHNMLFWYDVSEPVGTFANTLTATMMWNERLVGMHFPSPVAHHGTWPNWDGGTKVAILALPARKVLVEADPVFAPHNCRLHVLAVHTFEHRGVPAMMIVTEIRDRWVKGDDER